MPMGILDPLPENHKAGWRIDEFASATGLSRNFVNNLIRTGRLDSVKVGDARVIMTSPQQFLEAQRVA